MTEGDDLRNIASAVHMQASRSMTLLAFDSLLRVIGMAIVLRHLVMAGTACVIAHAVGAGDLRVVGIGVDDRPRAARCEQDDRGKTKEYKKERTTRRGTVGDIHGAP